MPVNQLKLASLLENDSQSTNVMLNQSCRQRMGVKARGFLGWENGWNTDKLFVLLNGCASSTSLELNNRFFLPACIANSSYVMVLRVFILFLLIWFFHCACKSMSLSKRLPWCWRKQHYSQEIKAKPQWSHCHIELDGRKRYCCGKPFLTRTACLNSLSLAWCETIANHWGEMN